MPSDSKLKVLVAEDEPAMLNLVARHVRGLGYSVIEASEGDTAWDLAQQHSPDLVILDVMMPGMSGWEICKRLKSPGSSGGQFASTGVIMLTGIGENLNEMTSSLFAADAWLNKPFDFNELDAKIRETLGRYSKAEGGRVNGVNIVDDIDQDDADDHEDDATEVIPRTAPAPSPRSRGKAPAARKAAPKAATKAGPRASAKAAPARKAAPAKKGAAKKKPAPAKRPALQAKGKAAAKKPAVKKPARAGKKPARRR